MSAPLVQIGQHWVDPASVVTVAVRKPGRFDDGPVPPGVIVAMRVHAGERQSFIISADCDTTADAERVAAEWAGIINARRGEKS